MAMDKKSLHLMIISPERTVFDGEVEIVTVPGTAGRFTVLPHHAPIISSLEQGEVVYEVAGERQAYAIRGGFIEVNKNEVSICVA